MERNKSLGVIGANSMVGSRFCELSKIPLIKADLNGEVPVDITSQESVIKFFRENDFNTAVLLSAFTDVDGAEKQRDDKNGSCWNINVGGVTNIVEACKQFKRKLIFVSTDFVFDGKNGPYSEEDELGSNEEKLSWYGITKVEGERIITGSLRDFIILRISYPYRARFETKADFAKQILQKYDENGLYPLFADQQITPTFIDDIAPCIDLLVTKNETGIFHLASPELATPYAFGTRLLKIFNRDPNNVEQGNLESFLEKTSSTLRPLRGGMKTERIQSLGFRPTAWREGIDKIFQQSSGQLI